MVQSLVSKNRFPKVDREGPCCGACDLVGSLISSGSGPAVRKTLAAVPTRLCPDMPAGVDRFRVGRSRTFACSIGFVRRMRRAAACTSPPGIVSLRGRRSKDVASIALSGSCAVEKQRYAQLKGSRGRSTAGPRSSHRTLVIDSSLWRSLIGGVGHRHRDPDGRLAASAAKHTDSLGSGLGSTAATDRLRFWRDHHLGPGMSRRGSRWDSALAKALFSSLKNERNKRRIYGEQDPERADVIDYIAIM